MVSVETISIVFTGLSVSLAAFYYISTLRNAQRNQQLQLETRQAQLFMQIYDRFVTKDFQSEWRKFVFVYDWKNYDDYNQRYSPRTDLEVSSSIATLFHYFEGVGVLLEEDLIDSGLVAKLLSASVIQCWEKYEPIVRERRERTGQPRIFDKTEYLYLEMKKLRGEDWSYTGTQALEQQH